MIISAGHSLAEAAPSLCIEKSSPTPPAVRVDLRSSRKRSGPRGNCDTRPPTQGQHVADKDSSKAWPAPRCGCGGPSRAVTSRRLLGASVLGLMSHQDAVVACGMTLPRLTARRGPRHPGRGALGDLRLPPTPTPSNREPLNAVERGLPAGYPAPIVGETTRRDVITQMARDILSGDIYAEA